jgi:hypothetical protein
MFIARTAPHSLSQLALPVPVVEAMLNHKSHRYVEANNRISFGTGNFLVLYRYFLFKQLLYIDEPLLQGDVYWLLMLMLLSEFF